MIKEFENLSDDDVALLIKVPALVAVLAATVDADINEQRKADALKLAHLKTFTANPLLISYYEEVEKEFEKTFNEIVDQYAPISGKRQEELEDEINEATKVIAKLPKKYAVILRHSLSLFAQHVKKADRTVLEGFMMPFKLEGITD